jgi:hypothetical protein
MKKATLDKLMNIGIYVFFLVLVATVFMLLYNIIVNNNIENRPEPKNQENLRISDDRAGKLYEHLYRR